MIVALHEGVDFLHQIVDAGERTPANGAPGDDAKSTFHLIKPRGISSRVVHLVARPLCEPIANLRMFVGGVVIDDEMDLVGWRNVLIEMAQEGAGRQMKDFRYYRCSGSDGYRFGGRVKTNFAVVLCA